MRTVWIEPADVTGDHCEPGRLVHAARPLSDWCLRADDGDEPIPTGTPLEIIEQRPWGKAMAREAHGAARRPCGGRARTGGGDDVTPAGAMARDGIDPDCSDCQDAVYEAVAQNPALRAAADAVMADAMRGWRARAARAKDGREPMPAVAFEAAS
ncbi:MAG: hypothetical protein OXE53_18375 [Deltaproteobacteria bacterium]|nr:hypothetical protein [Deltaproteobacteria bacterium]